MKSPFSFSFKVIVGSVITFFLALALLTYFRLSLQRLFLPHAFSVLEPGFSYPINGFKPCRLMNRIKLNSIVKGKRLWLWVRNYEFPGGYHLIGKGDMIRIAPDGKTLEIERHLNRRSV